MPTFHCWDPDNQEPDEAEMVCAASPLRAAEAHANQDTDGHTDGLYCGVGGEVAVRDEAGDVSRYLVRYVDHPEGWHERLSEGAELRAVCLLDQDGEPGWYADDTWEEVMGGVEHVWWVRGPAPFGGLRAGYQAQAERVADRLNLLHGRKPPEPTTPPVEPDPTALAFAKTVVETTGLRVTVSGSTITLSEGDASASDGDQP